mmetsp:Transcript_65729/g.183018  ORF Transcript_65729/g.183018 Transcript_65729/m.183018 type:complete len:212 (+) Transcript_65729:450-1085(+)
MQKCRFNHRRNCCALGLAKAVFLDRGGRRSHRGQARPRALHQPEHPLQVLPSRCSPGNGPEREAARNVERGTNRSPHGRPEVKDVQRWRVHHSKRRGRQRDVLRRRWRGEGLDRHAWRGRGRKVPVPSRWAFRRVGSLKRSPPRGKCDSGHENARLVPQPAAVRPYFGADEGASRASVPNRPEENDRGLLCGRRQPRTMRQPQVEEHETRY